MKGIDISSWQRGLYLPAAGVDFAILKISEGRTWNDPCFDGFYNDALGAGIPLGAYVFSYATTTSAAIEEAKHALNLLHGRKLPLGLYIDVEDDKQLALSDSVLTAVVSAFCDTVRAAGYTPGAYGSAGQLWAKVGPSYLGSDVLVWKAAWGNSEPSACDVWQYTDHDTVSGFSGNVDGDKAVSERFKALVQGAEIPSAPEPPADSEQPVEEIFTIENARALRKGDTGDAVKALQGELIAYGYSCGGKKDWRGAEKPDGIFGPVTEESVRSFQRSKNITDSGVADKRTRTALLGF